MTRINIYSSFSLNIYARNSKMTCLSNARCTNLKPRTLCANKFSKIASNGRRSQENAMENL